MPSTQAVYSTSMQLFELMDVARMTKSKGKQQDPERNYVELLLQDMESAAILGCSVPTVWRRRKDGKLRFVRISPRCVTGR